MIKKNTENKKKKIERNKIININKKRLLKILIKIIKKDITMKFIKYLIK